MLNVNSKNQCGLNFIIGNIVLNACLKANLASDKHYLSLTTPHYFDNESLVIADIMLVFTYTVTHYTPGTFA